MISRYGDHHIDVLVPGVGMKQGIKREDYELVEG
jgi:hypothetical protein